MANIDVLQHESGSGKIMKAVADWVFWAGQALSLCGLAYGGFLAATYCEPVIDARTRGSKPAMLHHLAMT